MVIDCNSCEDEIHSGRYRASSLVEACSAPLQDEERITLKSAAASTRRGVTSHVGITEHPSAQMGGRARGRESERERERETARMHRIAERMTSLALVDDSLVFGKGDLLC